MGLQEQRSAETNQRRPSSDKNLVGNSRDVIMWSLGLHEVRKSRHMNTRTVV